MVFFAIILNTVINTVIIMASYNYVGPTLSSLFTGNTKEVSNEIFVPISFWESMVLTVLFHITKSC